MRRAVGDNGRSLGTAREGGRLLRTVATLVIVAIALPVVYGVAQPKTPLPQLLQDVSVALAVALAAAAVGGLVGLLFGIPRGILNLDSTTPATGAAGAPTAAVAPVASPTPRTTALPPSAKYLENTNLVQVSDWLTKILLGAGLTQLGRAPRALSSLGRALAEGVGTGTSAQVFAEAIVVLNLTSGFLYGYLLTRLRLGAALSEADALNQAVSAASAEVKQTTPAAEPDTPPASVGQISPTDAASVATLAQTVISLTQRSATPAFDADVYRRLAQQLVASGNARQAGEMLRLGLMKLPDDASLWLYLGTIQAVHLKDFDGAEASYHRALAIDPKSAVPVYNLACSSARRGNKELAKAYLDHAYALNPNLKAVAAGDQVWDDLSLRHDPVLEPLLTNP